MIPDPVSDPQQALEILRAATAFIREDPNREGNLLKFGSAGQLVATGDMHGNRKNFAKLQRYCNLERSPARSVVLHELIHEEPQPPHMVDLSIDLLLDVLQWKVEYPDNVFFLQSNHELSQWRGHDITKGGRSVLTDFERGVEHRFPGHGLAVTHGVIEYISALPLAARTASGIFMAHSLPSGPQMVDFDARVLTEPLQDADLEPGGSGYDLVWGRFQRPTELDAFAEKLEIETFVVGHTPQEDGLAVTGRMIIIASDHNHGVFLPIDLAKSYTSEELAQIAKKFVAVE